MRGVMADWLHWLERDPDRFDAVTINNRTAMHRAYAAYHVTPGARAQSILFENVLPEGSKLSALRQLAKSNDPQTWLQLVEKHRLPYRILVSVLPDTPAAKLVLVAAMTPTEALNSRAWMERSGLLNMPEVRDAYTAKVGKADRSAASAEHRKSAQGADAGVQAVVNIAKDRSAAKQQRIQKSTLLAIDISGSMAAAITAGVELAARVAPLCDVEPFVAVFNDYAARVMARDTTLTAWQDAFRGVRAGGQTNPSAALALALDSGYMPEQLVIVTDGGENRMNLAGQIKAYEESTGTVLHVFELHVPGQGDSMVQRFDAAGVSYDKFEFDGKDYYILDQIAALLAGERGVSLVERILKIELPHR
jgi:hypothetical protein